MIYLVLFQFNSTLTLAMSVHMFLKMPKSSSKTKTQIASLKASLLDKTVVDYKIDPQFIGPLKRVNKYLIVERHLSKLPAKFKSIYNQLTKFLILLKFQTNIYDTHNISHTL